MTTFWTAQRVETLKQMHSGGSTQSHIAKTLGTSRNTIAGKVARMGLKRGIVKPTYVKRALQNRHQRPGKPIVPVVRTGSVSFLASGSHQCRAIVNDDPMIGEVFCCGEPRAEGSSWCAFHRGLYTQPPAERNHHGQTGRHY